MKPLITAIEAVATEQLEDRVLYLDRPDSA
jgi:hypothetical protein